MTFFTITILSRSVPSRLVRLVPSVRSRGAKVSVGGLGEWKGSRPWETRRADCGRGRQLKSVLFTFFPLCLFFFPSNLRRLWHDAFSCFLFLVFYTVGGARRFGLVWVGWVKKRFGLVLGFVVLCLDWEGWRERRGAFVVWLPLPTASMILWAWMAHWFFLPVWSVLQRSAGG